MQQPEGGGAASSLAFISITGQTGREREKVKKKPPNNIHSNGYRIEIGRREDRMDDVMRVEKLLSGSGAGGWKFGLRN